ncbi:hypothetical protein [Cellulomonas sp. P5_C5]
MSTPTDGVGSAQADEGGRAFAGRTGAAYAALGGGLVLVALGAEHLGHHSLLGVTAAVLGAAEIGWAVAALRGPAPLPRLALATLVVGAVGWLVSATATGPLGLADVTAAGLQLVAAILLAVAVRPAAAATRPTRPLTRLGILALGSLVTATLTVPGLAATEAGTQAPGMPGMGSSHHGHG